MISSIMISLFLKGFEQTKDFIISNLNVITITIANDIKTLTLTIINFQYSVDSEFFI